jgi:hypothetical protein
VLEPRAGVALAAQFMRERDSVIEKLFNKSTIPILRRKNTIAHPLKSSKINIGCDWLPVLFWSD